MRLTPTSSSFFRLTHGECLVLVTKFLHRFDLNLSKASNLKSKADAFRDVKLTSEIFINTQINTRGGSWVMPCAAHTNVPKRIDASSNASGVSLEAEPNRDKSCLMSVAKCIENSKSPPNTRIQRQ